MADTIPEGYAHPGAPFVPGAVYWNPFLNEKKDEIPTDENGDPIHGEDC